jgi:integrase
LRQSSERVYGPYHEPDRGRWRIILHRADGAREAIFFTEETAAYQAANAARNATETRTLTQAMEEYLASIPDKGRQTAAFRLRALLQLPSGDRLLRQVTASHAAKLYRERCEKVKPATHHGELQLARRMFQWAIERGWVRENPFSSVKATGTPGKGKPKLRVNPSRAFLAYLLRDDSVEATAVMTAFMLGLRASEVVKRVTEDLDDDGWLLWIRDTKTEAGDREIEVPGVLRARLMALCDGKGPTDRIFGEVSRHWLHYHTVRLCDAAGVPRVTPHGLRGSGVTNAVRMGGSLEQVAQAAGHADAHTGADTLRAHYLGGGALESARARRVAALVEETDAN